MKRISITNGDVEIVAESWAPMRKKPVLAIMSGTTCVKYASFNSEESAESFMNLLAQFVGAKEET